MDFPAPSGRSPALGVAACIAVAAAGAWTAAAAQPAAPPTLEELALAVSASWAVPEGVVRGERTVVGCNYGEVVPEDQRALTIGGCQVWVEKCAFILDATRYVERSERVVLRPERGYDVTSDHLNWVDGSGTHYSVFSDLKAGGGLADHRISSEAAQAYRNRARVSPLGHALELDHPKGMRAAWGSEVTHAAVAPAPETVGGLECWRVDGRLDGPEVVGTRSEWRAPARGFRLVRQEDVRHPLDTRQERQGDADVWLADIRECLEFQLVGGRVWLPSVVSARHYERGGSTDWELQSASLYVSRLVRFVDPVDALFAPLLHNAVLYGVDERRIEGDATAAIEEALREGLPLVTDGGPGLLGAHEMGGDRQ